MELSWLPKRGSYYTNTCSELYAMLEPLLVFSSFLALKIVVEGVLL